jgi:hypothetical protein
MPLLPQGARRRLRDKQDFLKERDDFEVDRSQEKFLIGFNPGGWLRKVG